MLHKVTLRVVAIAACAWLLAGEAAALTLGRARGAVLIGRPLEVAIPVTLDTAQGDAPCTSADLYYGDDRVAGPVNARWEARGGAEGVVRVSAATPVQEPIVTLYLRVGCGQPNTRRYVMLSELPPENEPAARAPAIQSPVVAAPAARSTPTPAPAAPVAPPRVRERPPVVAQAPAIPTAQPAPRARRAPAPAPAPAQPRLRLEPLDLDPEREATLRLSPELATQAGADPQQRQAFAALWLALQKDPRQSVEDAVRLQGVERELASLRDTTRQNAAAVARMKAQVEEAEAGRQQAGWLVIALAAALAAVLAGVAWRWHRARQLENVGRWFEAHGESTQLPLGPVPPAPPAPRAATPNEAAVKAPVTRPAPLVPANVSVAAAAAAGVARASASTWGEFQQSRGGSVRMVGVEELIDVHDKADFFLSIGETEQAIAVLETHVHDQVETGALAWMDLLDLYHSLGRRADYERLRGEFGQRFTAHVPDFEHFDAPSASLESYSRALSRIVALWPSRKVLDAIEESIFRNPGLAGAEPFSLEAYRELVLLYHIASDMLAEAQDTQPPVAAATTGFSDTSLEPLHMLDRPAEEPLTDRERLMIPPASARLGVDIDLEDPEPVPARELPDLDFDVSTFDPAHRNEVPQRDPGRE